MPSPVGHVIAGVTCGWLVAGTPRRDRRQRAREAVLFGALGAAADLDLLVNAHSGPTHSVGAALVVALAAGLVATRAGPREGGRDTGGLGAWRTLAAAPPAVFALACAAAYGSHVLLDWLARDSTPPIGVMALWPFQRAHYESDLHVFMAISRRYYQGWTFVRQNAVALVGELMILIPCLTLVAILRRRRDA
jgi:LexA-binding, inner membrane-associated putative hydrolase